MEGGLETIPRSGTPPNLGHGAPLSSLSHSPAWGLHTGSDPPAPQRAPGSPCLTRAPYPGLCYPGDRGAGGEEGKESCQEEELSHSELAKALPVSSPLPPRLTRSPALQGERPLLLKPTVLLGPPFISTNTLAFGTRVPSGSLGTTAGSPKPRLSPQGLLAVPVPRSPPSPLPRAHPRPGLWLRSGIAHSRGHPFPARSVASRDRCRHPGQGRGGSGPPLCGNTHPPTVLAAVPWLAGTPGLLRLPAVL